MYRTFIKPFFDFLVALIAVIALLPIGILVFLVLKLSRVANPFFQQPRPGKGEKIFHILKFKTMTDETDEDGHLLSDDRRLTTVGSVLRKTSLDELPQLFNVLRGDMSLVGPRPLRVRYLPYYTDRENLRHSVKPGITGLAQVSGRNALSWDDRLELDALYTENIGCIPDCKILVKTLVKIFRTSEVEFSEGPDSLDEQRRIQG